MKWEFLRTCALIAMTATPLSGCLVLSALLGASSFVLTGPAQYIGTVYTIGEYTYELAANNKTPDMVIKEKLAWLAPNQEETAQDVLLTEAEPTAPVKTLRARLLPQPVLEPEAEPVPIEVAMLGPVRIPAPKSQAAKIPTQTPAPKKAITKKTLVPKAEKQTQATHAPTPRIISISAATTPPPAPLLRIQRMEQAFHAADQIMADGEQGNEIRITLPQNLMPNGINGSWRIRHRIS